MVLGYQPLFLKFHENAAGSVDDRDLACFESCFLEGVPDVKTKYQSHIFQGLACSGLAGVVHPCLVHLVRRPVAVAPEGGELHILSAYLEYGVNVRIH